MPKSLLLGTTERKELNIPANALLKHFACFGGTGSGKTVLTKVLIEECALAGIPSIVIDSQGDLASLSILGTSPQIKEQGLDEKQKAFESRVEVLTYTPTSSKGIPLSVNPLAPIPAEIDEETAIGLLSQRAEALATILDYRLDSDPGKAASSIIYLALETARKGDSVITSIDSLISFLEKPTPAFQSKIASIASARDVTSLVKKLKYMTIGERKLLFSFGAPIEIDRLLGKGSKKTRISVIYMNSLDTQGEKDFFLSMLAQNLYQWMLTHPSQQLQALFVIDEIAPYLPAGMKLTLSKGILQILYKQARKYGVGCVVSSQNPGDIEYKALAQFSSWALGRLTTKQDRAKIQDALKSLSSNDMTDTIKGLASVAPLNFVLFSPDNFSDVQKFTVRYLLTNHVTLTEQALSPLVPKKFKEVKAAKERDSGLPAAIAEQEARRLAEQKRLKRYLWFGPPVENIKQVRLVHHPYAIVHLKQLQSVWWGKPRVQEFTIAVDAVTGALGELNAQGFFPLSSPLKDLVGFDEETIKLYLSILRARNGRLEQELVTALGKDKWKKQLSYLRAEKLLISEETPEGRRWHALAQLSIPKTLKNAFQKGLAFQDVEVQEKIAHVVDEYLLPVFFRGLYGGVEVMNTSKVVLPEYKVELLSEDRVTRYVTLCGLSGRILGESHHP